MNTETNDRDALEQLTVLPGISKHHSQRQTNVRGTDDPC